MRQEHAGFAIFRMDIESATTGMDDLHGSLRSVRRTPQQGRGGAVERQLSYACSFRLERRQSADPGRTPVNLCIGLDGTEALYDLAPTTAPTSVPPLFILFYGLGPSYLCVLDERDTEQGEGGVDIAAVAA